MNVLDIFSGIGGFSLGFERAGMRTVAFCEIEPYARAVLAKHWPTIPIYDDVRQLTGGRLTADVWHRIDVICGGFPCQDVSLAGSRVGLGGERSGLWSEFARLIREIRPRFAVVENTPGLLSLGMGRVLGDLATIGYDAEWHCIPAACLNADHERDRVWIVAYPHGTRLQPYVVSGRESCAAEMGEVAPDPGQNEQLQPQGPKPNERRPAGNGSPSNVSNANRARHPRRSQAGALNENAAIFGPWIRSLIDTASGLSGEHWNHQPVLGRGIHGVPNRLDRIGALGNAVVPQIPEIIGRAIMRAAA